MRIQIDLDPKDVWRLQARAEALGVTPGDILRTELGGRQNAETVRQRITAYHADLFCDADMAAEMGYTVGQIAHIRRGLGLKANPRYTRNDNARKG